MIHDRNSHEVTIAYSNADLFQRYIQGAHFMNVVLTSVAATTNMKC